MANSCYSSNYCTESLRLSSSLSRIEKFRRAIHGIAIVTKLRKGKLPFRLLVAGLILLVSWATASSYLYASKRSANDIAFQSKLTGTWAVESGNLLNFRSDGSGITRSNDSEKTINVFKWNASRNELRLFTSPLTQKLQYRIGRYFLGAPFRFEIVELSTQSLHLIDKSTGEKHVLNKTTDQPLDNTPQLNFDTETETHHRTSGDR